MPTSDDISIQTDWAIWSIEKSKLEELAQTKPQLAIRLVYALNAIDRFVHNPTQANFNAIKDTVTL